MILVIPPELVGQYRPQLEEMHRLRYRVFKERMDWDVNVQNGLEFDVYDTLAPTYFLALDDTGTVVGTWRLLPTTGPNMLRDTFADLLEGKAAPCHDDVWETSRFAVEAPDNPDGRTMVSTITRELFCGLVEYCLMQGIDEVVTVYDIRIARLLPQIGCDPRWQTARKRIGNTIALAGGFEISEAVLSSIRTAGNITQSVLVNLAALRRAA